ncbi:MAG: DUF2817 domain-containing protein [Alphaproteobacteria bacterium]|nr:DUF2817 domain-containing protein [Alphaproteobacteria bacterium]
MTESPNHSHVLPGVPLALASAAFFWSDASDLDDRTSDEYKTAAAWWAPTNRDRDAFAAGAVPSYQGLLCQAIKQEQPEARIAGAVIEFGTCDAYTLFRADRLDRWLRFEGRMDANYDRYRDNYKNACCPGDVAWRQQVLTEVTEHDGSHGLWTIL